MIIPLKYVKIERFDEGVTRLSKRVRISTSLLPNNSYLVTINEYDDLVEKLPQILLQLVHGSSEEELRNKLDEEPEEYPVDPAFCITRTWNKHNIVVDIGDNPFREGTSLHTQFDNLVIGESPWEQSKNRDVTMPMTKKAFDLGSITIEE